jgi:stage V sporulation protein B
VAGAALLAASSLLARFLGVFFRIPIIGIIGKQGFAYYELAYPLYAAFLSLSTAGLPTAISKLVSERASLGSQEGANRAFRLSFALLALLGALSSCMMHFGAESFSRAFSGNAEVAPSIRALAPAPFFVSILSAFRGYFQGMGKMGPTALSQIVDQALRVTVGVALSAWAMEAASGPALGAACATFGATAGAIASALLLGIGYMFYSFRHRLPKTAEAPQEALGALALSIAKTAFPIACASLLSSLVGLINSYTLADGLAKAGVSYRMSMDYIAAIGEASTILNVPLIVGSSLCVSILPSISSSLARGHIGQARAKADTALKLSLLVGAPASVGLWSLAYPVMELLYPGATAMDADILGFYAWEAVFSLGMCALQGVLQGSGRYWKPLANMLAGGALKYALNVLLIPIPSLNVFGSAAATVAATALIFFLNLRDASKALGVGEGFGPASAKICASSLAMGVFAVAAYRPLSFLPRAYATVLTVLLSMAFYAALVLASGAFRFSEIRRPR